MQWGTLDEGGARPSESEVFEFCGPRHLTCVDWRRPQHRQSVAASLVKGVYVLERDCQNNRTGGNELAPWWWEFFHFKPVKTLRDQVDSSVIGVIFEYKHDNNYFTGNRFNSSVTSEDHTPPKYAIAFRGTLIKRKTEIRDLYLDAKIILNELNCSSRCKIAFEAVEGLIRGNIKELLNPNKDVWLIGHSLGAAIALQTGRDMFKLGYNLQTYLFNPPFASFPIGILPTRVLKSGTRLAKSVVTAGLSLALKRTTNGEDDPFTILRDWIPCLFVNPKDPICCEYVEYFEHREKMERRGMGKIERIATKNSIVSLISGALGKHNWEASFLIPSALVTKNMKNMIVREHGLLVAHGLCQWWEQHSRWQSKTYQYV
ncbi:hypothetical protein SOVF_054950 [Spinacia oleracea]|nr:hypothetical protein SOVF_054950 [Spinacia oleracea]